VYLPELVRSLADRAAPERVLAALDEVALDGLVELRPESGLGTLSSEDAALCLPGPQGSVLSYAR
jgi:hypothetical protein